MTTTVPAFECCGVRIDAHTIPSAVDAVVAAARDGRGSAVHLCNAYVLALASRDQHYARLLDRGDVNLADGMPVVWVARRLGLSGAQRVPGAELFARTLRAGVEYDLRHAFYGSTPEVIAALTARVAARWPEVRIVHAESPPFGPVTAAGADALLEVIERSAAQVVWVGLGTPKQDELIGVLEGRTPAVLVSIGAAFEFLAGTKKRAPEWMQRTGLEWVHRLGSEPRRLWRRYLVGNTRFVVAAARSSRVVTR